MLGEIGGIIINSAEGSFLQVTVFVGAVLLIFGYINYKKQGGLVAGIEKARRWQPVLGAFLGLTPGCGGAIFIMPLYLKGSVSFGTVVATLIATAGDSAFVMISTLPLHYLVVSGISFAVAIATGYVVDSLKVGVIRGKKVRVPAAELDSLHGRADHRVQEIECRRATGEHRDRILHLGHEEGDEIDLALHHKAKGHQPPGTLGYSVTHGGFWFYWMIIAVGLVLGIVLLCQIDLNADLAVPHLGTIIGVAGTLLSIVLIIMGKKFLRDDTHEESELKLMSLKETLVHNAQETAFVGTWVFAAYLIYEFVIFGLGGGDYAEGEALAESFMTSAGLAAVIVGALVGIIPGCGPQIIFVALFVKGWLPFAALLANAVSQDGDALFPLLAMDRKSALRATVITTIPALVVGIAVYVLEINFFAGLLHP